jgi:hypothetical protein
MLELITIKSFIYKLDLFINKHFLVINLSISTINNDVK